ncbi:MAG: ParB/RepB/Spo0J family partition protein [Chitinophagaceae bacterium]
MTTTIKHKRKPTVTKLSKGKAIPANTTLLRDADFAQIKTDDIDFSPLNYRKYFSEDALQAFAEELKQHGIISPLTVRVINKNSYELVAGERRLRAARIAGLEAVPAAVVSLTDEQVIEIQLAENLQRENPHPMHEAQAIGQMQQTGKTIDEIAVRLGKSKQFVYTRLKLLSLIDSFRGMVLANVISLQEALLIAALSAESQAEFFNEHCNKWKQQKNFEIHNLDYYLNQYRYDLKNAPFNTKDKNLVQEVGACSGCPSNSATLKSLFPEMAKQSVCSNKECYNNKCTLHFIAALSEAINTYQPTALLYNNQLTDMAEKIIILIPRASELTRHNANEITVIQKPALPDKKDYLDYDSEELDEDEFNGAMDNYYSELGAYNLHVKSGHYAVAVFLGNKTFEPVYFSMDKPKQYHLGGQTVTAKEVQAAIKTGNATPELLQDEIDRIKQREKRAEELDTEKVQLIVHNDFTEFVNSPANNTGLTDADKTGLKLIVYQALDYTAKSKVAETLLTRKGKRTDDTNKDLFERFSNLSESEFTYLIRMAICCKSDSKYPSQEAGYFLYRMAEDAGIPVKTIEDTQAAKRKERKEKQDVKIQELKKKLNKLKKK